MGRVVQFLYNEWLRYKAEGNSGMSELCKLVMNAVSFGALIPKPAETKAVMVQNDNTLKYLANHFLEVKRARKCGLVYEVECYSDDPQGYALQVGRHGAELQQIPHGSSLSCARGARDAGHVH